MKLIVERRFIIYLSLEHVKNVTSENIGGNPAISELHQRALPIAYSSYKVL